MDAVTYPHPDVRRFLDVHVELLKVDVANPPPWARTLLRNTRVLWTPTLLVVLPGGAEVRRRIGFAPPSEFMAELLLALGQDALRRGDHARAHQRFREAEEQSRPGGVAPEALFWQGIAAYKRDRATTGQLRTLWDALRLRYPDSDWWDRADVFPPD